MTLQGNSRPAVAGNYVYWIDGDENLERAATDGSGHKIVIGGGYVGAFVVADGGVYWVSSINDGSPGSAVYFTPDGGQAAQLAGGQYAPSAVVLQGATLFWADFFSANDNPGTIWSMPKSGGTPSVLMNNVTVMRMAPTPNGGLIVDAQRQATYQTPFLMSGSGQVTNLPTNMDLLWDLDASDSYAAWGDGYELGVYSFSTKKTKAANINAKAVAIMGSEVLVANRNGGLEGVSLPGLADKVLLPDLQIDKIAAADGFVYIFSSDGTLLRWTR